MPDSRQRGAYDSWVRAGLVAFLLVNVMLVAVNGIRTGGDTGLYLDGAQRMLQGQPLIEREPSYTGYIAVIALSTAIGAGVAGVIALQLLAATLAAYAMSRIAGALGGSFAAAIAVWLLTADVDTNRWHQFVLSDSLFLSLATISTWLVYRAAIDGSVSLRLATIAVMVAAALVRPEGWFLLPCALVFWVWRAGPSPGVRVAGVAGVAVVCAAMLALVVPRLGGNLQAVGPADMLRAGNTIWDFDGWRLQMPVDPIFEDGDRTSRDAVIYALRHPVDTAMLMAARLGVHFAHVRPFFSFAHNAAIAVWLLPVYAAALWALWRTRSTTLTRWLVVAIASQLIVVALTHADWDGRYLSHMMPLIYPLAAFAIATAAGRVSPSHDARV